MHKITIWPCSLRPTTRECARLVTGGYFWSGDEDDGHTIRSAIAENPMLHANFMDLCFIEPELLPIKVLHCGNRDFRFFCSCDLDLDSMTFIYELNPYSLEIYRICKYKLPTSRLSKVIVWHTYIHRQTDRADLRGWSKVLVIMVLFVKLG